jgi:hypothetical protein
VSEHENLLVKRTDWSYTPGVFPNHAEAMSYLHQITQSWCCCITYLTQQKHTRAAQFIPRLLSAFPIAIRTCERKITRESLFRDNLYNTNRSKTKMAKQIANPNLPAPPSGKYPAKSHARRVAKWLAENGGPKEGVIYLEGQALREHEVCMIGVVDGEFQC